MRRWGRGSRVGFACAPLQIQPVVQAALDKAGVTAADLDAIAYTLGPGLQGSLHVGTSFAKAMAWGWTFLHSGPPHARAHLGPCPRAGLPPAYPFLCLTVSGGHTQLVKVRRPNDMEVLGQTLDDAAGEAFDKVAKLIGLPYPGGPVVDKLAAQGNPEAFSFSRPRMDGYNWSFSGLKTQVLNFLKQAQDKDARFVQDNQADICASVQAAILDMLMAPLFKRWRTRASQSGDCGWRERQFRSARASLTQAERGWTVHIPPMAYCTDNAAMIAAVGWLDALDALEGTLEASPSPKLPALTSLAQPKEG